MKKMTAEEFIKKATKVHGDTYGYDKTMYVNSLTKIEIVCPEKDHGIFMQTPGHHLHGNGCPRCRGGKISKIKTHSRELVIVKFKKVHGDRYDYGLMKYTSTHTKIEIVCPEKDHGSFLQEPNSHLEGKGCPKCKAVGMTLSQDEFITRALSIHHNKYGYSLVKYIHGQEKVKIICPKHKEFWQRPNNHVSLRQGCPSCAKEITTSKGEIAVGDYIQSLHPKLKIIRNDRSQIFNLETGNGLELDILIPELNLAIEYQGSYWHDNDKSKTRDRLKIILCKEKNIKLYEVHDHDWKKDPQPIKLWLNTLITENLKINNI